MAENFKNILTLIDFSDVSLRAADEAALISSKFNSQLHLLHVTNTEPSYLITPEIYLLKIAGRIKKFDSVDRKLEKIKEDLVARFGIDVQYSEAEGRLCETVNKKALELSAELIVLGVDHTNWFRKIFLKNKVKHIIRSVDTEVLCVYPESNSKKLKKIVLPIGKFIPKRKIRLAYELAKKFAAHIHLVTLNKQGINLNSEDTKILMASYQYLKDITNIPVKCSTVFGNNLAQATVQYAENIGADLILINTGAESFFKKAVLGGWRRSIVDHSSIPVLSVHAVNEKSKHKQYRA